MTYLEKRQLLEDFMQMVAPGVKSLIESLSDSHLNESLNTEYDLFEEFIAWSRDAVKLLLCEERMPRGYWTEEKIRQIVKDNNIKSRKELEEYNSSAYAAANRLNILNDLFGDTLHKSWDEQTIIQFVKDNNITSRNELQQKSTQAYRKARLLGLVDKLFGNKLTHDWSKEECKKLALKCKYRTDFYIKYPNAYNAAIRNGWFDEITKHMPEQKREFDERYTDYCVYVYEELNTHAVYVGLTNNISRRDKDHRKPTSDGYDSLALYCIENNVDIPKVEIKKDNLDSTTARRLEFKYWYEYRDAGWTMINSELKLGFLGGLPRKWTKDSIYLFVKLNPNIDTITKLQRCSNAAYKAAKRLNILDDLFVRLKKDRNFWTKENIFKFVSDNNITSRHELEKKSGSAYNVARRLNILDDLFGTEKKSNRSWTKEKIQKVIEDNPQIKSKNDLQNFNRNAYSAAWRLGILDELFPKSKERKPMAYWNKEDNVIKEASKYKTPAEFHDKNRRAYNAWVLFGKPMNWLKQEDD